MKLFAAALLAAVYSIGLVVAGYSYAQRGKGDAIEALQKDDSKKVAVAKAEARIVEKVVVKYVNRIKTIKDTSGCADYPADPDIVDSLQQVFNSAKRPEAD